MTMTWPQSRALRDELTEITLHPEKHDQGWWVKADSKPENDTEEALTACGTTGCLAGNAVISAGRKLVWEPRMRWNSNTYEEEPTGQWKADYCLDPTTGRRESIHTEAQHIFGLTFDQAETLFSSGRTVPELWDYSIRYSAGLITVSDMAKAYEERLESEYDRGVRDGAAKAKTEVRRVLGLGNTDEEN